MSAPSVKVETFGCRLNALEGDVISEAAKQAGLTHATIINGCAVTAEAMRQARQAARKAKRDIPEVIHEIEHPTVNISIDARIVINKSQPENDKPTESS